MARFQSTAAFVVDGIGVRQARSTPILHRMLSLEMCSGSG